jgi:rare lipoprotein A
MLLNQQSIQNDKHDIKKMEYSTRMNKLNLAFSALLLSLLVGCSSTSVADDQKTRSYARSHELVGQASWYGRKYYGKLTASGERYNKRAYTAAHRTLPFGTIVRVTNTTNSKSVDVKINDRGPFVKGPRSLTFLKNHLNK